MNGFFTALSHHHSSGKNYEAFINGLKTGNKLV